MPRTFISFALCASFFVLAGCPETSDECAPGFMEVGDDCVPVADAGDADAGDEDGSMPVDAGPCDGMCSGTTPLCRESDDTCVACLSDTDCTDVSAPRCDTAAGTCMPCDDSSQCTGRTGTELCATDGPNTGSCVECTATERDACDMGPIERNVCDALTNTCTGEEPGSATVCDPCVSDLQCSDGQLCVGTEFNADSAMMAIDGYFCLWTEAAEAPGPAGSCSANGRPYLRRRMDVTSIEGTTDVVCDLAVSTCVAQTQFRTAMCDGEGAAGNAMCGVDGLEDAYCADRDSGGGGDFRCTTRCGSDDDCPPGFGCNMPIQQCRLF